MPDQNETTVLSLDKGKYIINIKPDGTVDVYINKQLWLDYTGNAVVTALIKELVRRKGEESA